MQSRCAVFALAMGALLAEPAAHAAERAAVAFNRSLFDQIDRHVTGEGGAKVGLGGDLAWGESYVMLSYLEMYEATKDTRYLEKLVEHADQVLKQRDDQRGFRDYSGRSRPAWSVSDKYTVAELVLKGRGGADVLRFRSTRYAFNDQTRIQVTTRPGSDTFDLVLDNPHWKTHEEFAGVSLDRDKPECVERKVNACSWVALDRHILCGEQGSTLVTVEILGDSKEVPCAGPDGKPLNGRAIPMEPLAMAYHGYSGQTTYPMLAFAWLVKKDAGLGKRFGKTAEHYVAEAVRVFKDAEEEWRDGPQEGEGYYITGQRGCPFWSDGVGKAFNYQCSLGRSLIRLAQLTGDAHWEQHAKAIARLFKRHLRLNENGAYVWDYWWGAAEKGWTREDSPSFNTPTWKGYPTIEDVSHGHLDIDFVCLCAEAGWVFDARDMRRFADTFLKNVVDKNKWTMNDRVDGKSAWGQHDAVAGGWCGLAVWEPEVARCVRRICEEQRVYERAAGSAMWTVARAIKWSGPTTRPYAASMPAPGEFPEPHGKYVVEPFDYHGVVLDDGPLLRQVLEVREDYLRVPNDDYLKGFRRRAGRPAPGAELGGWYKDDVFHVFGQVLSGLARMYAATGEPACREKLNALVHEWGLCIEPDGYFFYSRKPNAPHYIYEKTVCGLVDAYVYGHNAEAVGLLGRITDWAEKNLDRKNEYAFNFYGGPTEWYTLSENLYRAYLATGQTRYRDFARVWEFSDYWGLYADGKDIFSRKDNYHAYSHCNTLSGAAAAYRVTGERRYLDAITKAYDYFQEHQNFATGGYGPGEMLLPEAKLVESLDLMDNHFETQCGSWAAFKLCKALIGFTGDARYGDWVEQLVINGIGASIHMSATGEVYYYARYALTGSAKGYTVAPWCCCTGSRGQAIADYCDLVFFKSPDGLCVNLYTPATVTWDQRGTMVTVRQRTRFPEEERSHLIVDLSRDAEFAIKLRVPGWLAGPMTVAVNGTAVEARPDERHWLTISRPWRDGDRVDVTLPMAFAAKRFPASSASAFPAAIAYGPVVLAFRSPAYNPSSRIDFARLESNFVPAAGEPLTYRFAADPAVLVRPFCALKEGEPYYVYFDPAKAWFRAPPGDLRFSSGWAPGGEMRIGDMKVTTTPGATVEFAFTGVGVRWVGRKYDDAGRTEVRIDDKLVATVDQYDAAREVPFRYEVRDLPAGQHTIKLTTLAEKNPASKNRYVNIMGMDVLAVPAGGPPSRPTASSSH